MERINLTAEPIMMDDELLLPPFMAAIRQQWYKGEWGSVKAKARRRFVPLPKWAVEELQKLRSRDEWVGSEDAVFVGLGGKPLCENAIVQRHFKPAGKETGHAMAELARPATHFCNARGPRENLDRRTEGTDGPRPLRDDAALHARAEPAGFGSAGEARSSQRRTLKPGKTNVVPMKTAAGR
jgi:hypothetical protein